MKQRLDHVMVQRGLVTTRSQAESWIRLGKVKVAGKITTKPGYFVNPLSTVVLEATEQYVSRAGLKLASVAEKFRISFADKVVLDVGSSTGGFTDYALQHGASRVYAVDVGTDQLHPSLRNDQRVELHEKTDIRNFHCPSVPDIVVIDVSFISLTKLLSYIATQCDKRTVVLAMVKPQFEAERSALNNGVVKNDAIRRQILKRFEVWATRQFVIVDKKDSDISGVRGNRERFYLLSVLKTLGEPRH